MPGWDSDFNSQTDGGDRFAPITNVSLCSKAMMRAVERPLHLPGFVCFYGPSGWGKTFSATYVQLNQGAYYIHCQESWTRKAVLLAMTKELGLAPKKTNYELIEQICQQLASSKRPLIIDEFDHLVNRGAVEMIRDIYEGSFAAIMLIGEELLPDKLQRWERFHNRVLDWIPAQPADFDDCRSLSNFYCHEVALADDLLRFLLKECKGATRRIVVNIEKARVAALEIGENEMDLALWKRLGLVVSTGDAPKRRFIS